MNLTKKLKQRKITLESRLFELYGLKEEYSYIAHLRKELEAKKTEIDGLNLTIDSIRSENRRLEDNVGEGFIVQKQLEAAKKRIHELQETMSSRANQTKGQLEMLEGQVSRVQNQERSERCVDDPVIEKKLKDFCRTELAVLEVKRKNKELELEKRELMLMLVGAHARISNLSKTGKITEEVSTLRSSNEDLLEQVERLQKQRYGMVEELVYQRWLNSCLRFEVQSHHETPRRSYRTQSLSDRNSSSQSRGSSTSSGPLGSESAFITSSLGSKSGISRKTSLAQKVKTWGRSKIDSNKNNGLIRRFSTSILPSNVFVPKNGQNAANAKKDGSSFTISPETHRSLPARRVSFNDTVRKLESELQETATEEEMGCEKPNLDLDQPEQALGTDHNDTYPSDLLNRKQSEAVRAVIPSDLDHCMITEKEGEANGEADDMGARTSNTSSDRRGLEALNVKFIAAISVLFHLLLLLLCLKLFDFQGGLRA